MTESKKGRGGPRANSGGARPGAGRKPKAPVPVATTEADPKDFLLALMQDVTADQKVRLDAAKTLMPFIHMKLGEGGKKDEKQRAAQTAGAGKFAASAPPKLAIVGLR